MSERPSRWGIMAAIIRRDFTEFTRDRFYVLISILGLVFFALIFWLLPNTVDETITVGAYGPGIEQLLELASEEGEAGLELITYNSRQALGTAVEEGEDGVAIGLAFPDDFFETMAEGRRTTVEVLVTANAPDELREAMDAFVTEIAYAVSGNGLPVTGLAQDEIVLGVDRAGDQISLRERMRPMMAFLVLLIEMMSLAGILAAELQRRTVTAVVTTPARLSDFLTAKAIFGTLLAFVQAVILMVAIRSLGTAPVLLLTVLFLGALLVTGFALIAGAFGRDFLTVLFWSLLFMVPMMIPAFGLLFPGTASFWIKAIPSYGLVEAIVGITSYGDGWAETLPDLAMVLGWTLVAFAVGLAILRRKVETL
jgi:ABC-2 type transport system permease protein